MTHTKTPWEYSKINGQIQIYSERYNGNGERYAFPSLIARYNLVGDTDNEANAKHIVKCVNNHDQLVEALEIAKARILELHGEHAPNYSIETLGIIEQALKDARGE